MRFVTASLSLGLFSWLSYMVLTGRLGGDVGASGKARALSGIIDRAIEVLGIQQTSLALLGFGAILAFGIIAFGPREDDA